MNLQDLKITVILAILFGIFHTSCKHDVFYPPLDIDENEGFQFKKEQAFCKSNPDNEIWSITFTRDVAGNVIEEITFSDGSPIFKTTQTFNSSKQQLTDSTFLFNNGNWQLQYSNKFIYSRNLLSEILKFGADGKNTHKTNYSYQGNELRREEFWNYFENNWKFQYAYGFEFNGNGKLIKRESYQTENKDKVYDTVLYTYYSNKLIEEKRITQTGATSYVLKFTYTSKGLPNETIQDGNVIEKNFYDDDKLIEKHTFYFGIDPGFSQCNGNLIYKYGY
ncbi:MAG TPA: hypothetical protein VLQ91_01835 [Draconibacterium sp.]|nr:hypothetical protein [Draconibacterium sp.]